MPVVGDDGRLEGYVSIFSLGDYFIPKPKRATAMRKVTSSINAIIRSIGGVEVIAYDAATGKRLWQSFTILTPPVPTRRTSQGTDSGTSQKTMGTNRAVAAEPK